MLNKTPLQVSDEFQFVLNKLENTREHLFITGRAGTGKSTLLQLFRRTTHKKVVVLAPTGVAALNVKGQTIHSFFGFPPKLISRKEIVKRRNHRFFKKIDMVIIDEISMVRADIMDNIDYSLQINRDSSLPFGGVQMVFFGDLFQLPPVISSDFERQYFRTHYSGPYFFNSKILESGFPIEMIELNEVFRQEERRFIGLLDRIRLKHCDYDDLEDLNQRYIQDFEQTDLYITLSSRNAIVDQINKSKLESLETEPFSFLAGVTGDFRTNLFPTEAILRLKNGAQVMFVKNDPEKRFVNGTIGKIIELHSDLIKVQIADQNDDIKYIEVEKLDWEIRKYQFNEQTGAIESKVAGTFKQYPIKLAWAITIHKSQGKTFDRVIIDLGKGAFEYGQTYVALSRCRTLDGIVLKSPLRPRDIMVDERVTEYYNSMI